MIIPCIDIMGGKVVQLVQGREKALEEDSPLNVLERFAEFPEIQIIDLDAAMGRGSNDHVIELLANRAVTRVGGGVRSVTRAKALIEQGAAQVIIGTSAFGPKGINRSFLESIGAAIGAERIMVALDSKEGRLVISGWRESIDYSAEDVIRSLEPYCAGFLCTYVDKEGMMEGTDLDWFRRLRAATRHRITAAGGVTTMDDVRALHSMQVDAALGMALYTGRLKPAELAAYASFAGRAS